MLIACPFCGPRDLREFSIKGAARRMPSIEAAFEEWDDYIHLRDNPAGISEEYWHHQCCGSWLVVKRNTLSHEIIKTLPASEWRRELQIAGANP